MLTVCLVRIFELCLIKPPRWVQTEMGNGAAEYIGMGEAPHTIQQSCRGIQSQVSCASLYLVLDTWVFY